MNRLKDIIRILSIFGGRDMNRFKAILIGLKGN